MSALTPPPAPSYRKKLIEVALPLDAINAESAREKSIRHGHPSTLHLWWARRPLAAARAVLFASLVDDPGNDLPEERAKEERARLFRLIEQLVKWENSNNEVVLAAAREEIRKSTGGHPPAVLDPFAGGGSIPLEAQRLGLEAHASDLNPVAVLINKALIELPAKFRDHQPVNPDARRGMRGEAVAKSALAEDVRWYGRWMRDEAFRRIGHLYPKGPNGETVIAWLWARTVKCPNPACGARMPLVRSFALSTKKGKEAWVEPVVDHAARTVRFAVRQGTPTPAEREVIAKGTKNGRGANFSCIVCGATPEDAYIKAEGMEKRLGADLMAVVTEGKTGRTYLVPDDMPAVETPPMPDTSGIGAELPDDARNFWCKQYGLITYADLFTPRQLVALTTFSDLVGEARARVLADSGGDTGYADAVATYLAVAVSKLTTFHNWLARWRAGEGKSAPAFGRQAIPMVWDSAEVNPFAGAGGDFVGVIDGAAGVISNTPCGAQVGVSKQLDATSALDEVSNPILSTDPPYYDNIGYADLSDFCYVWLRRSLNGMYPDLFSTLLTPKAPELVATPYRFDGSRDKARAFFEAGLGKAFAHIRAKQHSAYPATIYYAYKQAEDGGDGSASTGWETMLTGLLASGFMITGSWPIRSELSTRMIASGTNALASSIVLVCRPRPENAPIATRKEFVKALQSDLPKALDLLINGVPGRSAIAPVDLAQAAIGPGMAIFSRYSQVLEASGEPMRVRTALELINGEIDRYFSEQEGEQDGPTRFCLAWYRSYGTGEGPYGQAETLSKATVVDIAALARLGLLTSVGGKVRLRAAREYPDEAWDPSTAHPLTTWECAHRLVRALTAEKGGAEAAARIIRRLGGKAEEARARAYLLYTEADKRGWLDDAQGYNALVAEWGVAQNAMRESGGQLEQAGLDW
jgi:putative DNA methylase